MKRLIYILSFILIAITVQVKAQQREQYSQYIMNNYLLNPAVGGAYTFWNMRVGFRKQWVGFRDNTPSGNDLDVGPKTFFTTFHGPINHPGNRKRSRRKKPHHGVGGYAYHDKTGPISYSGVFGSYAYHHKINRKVTASLGAWFGFKEFRINGDELHFVQDPIDDLIGKSVQNTFMPDLNVGTWIYSDQFFTGLSVNQLLQSRLKIESFTDGATNEALLKYHYFFTFGWIFQINRQWYFSPSTMVKFVYPAPVQFDVNLRIMYENIAWVGISYRNRDAINLVMEYVYNDTFEIGYAFDYTLSELGGYNKGSHEIIVGVRWGNPKREVICPAKFW